MTFFGASRSAEAVTISSSNVCSQGNSRLGYTGAGQCYVTVKTGSGYASSGSALSSKALEPYALMNAFSRCVQRCSSVITAAKKKNTAVTKVKEVPTESAVIPNSASSQAVKPVAQANVPAPVPLGNNAYVDDYLKGKQRTQTVSKPDANGRTTTSVHDGYGNLLLTTVRTKEGKLVSKRDEKNTELSEGSAYFEVNGTRYETDFKDDAIRAAGENGKITVHKSDGTTVAVDKNGKTYGEKGTIAGNDKLSDEERKSIYSDDCSESIKVAMANTPTLSVKEAVKKYGCRQTGKFAKGVEVGNQVLQTGGAMAVNLAGTAAANHGQTGLASNLQRGAAKAAKVARTYESNITLMNTAAAVLLARKSKQHANNAAEIADWQQKDAATKVNVLDHPDGSASADLAAKQYTQAIEKEQRAMQKQSSVAAMGATINALKSGMNATNAEMARKNSEKTANMFADQEKLARDNTLVWNPGALVSNGGVGDGAGSASTADESSSVGDTTTDAGSELLPNGNDTGAELLTPDGPKAAAFKPGSSAGSAAGGGGGGGALGGGGASTAGGGGSEDATKAAYASEFGTKERYETGGSGGAPGAGRAGSRAGGKDDGGIDLNGLLAQFLPKAEEEMPNRNGILDFAAGGGAKRMPANEESASYLDKNADLFQRIHETMSEKNRKGQVGT